jgi:hypothetical protein
MEAKVMSESVVSSTARAFLLRLLDEAYSKKAWHGPNLKGSIRRVTPELAGWRPRNGRKCIAEIVLHCAYWKYATRRRIRGDKRGSFVLKGSNWFDVPSRLSEASWREYSRILDKEHETLRQAIVDAPASSLMSATRSGVIADHIQGVALHDLYHAGQIQTLKALKK